MNNWINFNILVVEDDAGMLEILGDILEGYGGKVFRATHGEEALNCIDKERIDLVLSDVQMPIMGGIDLVKNIRIKNLKIPVVLFITGQSELTEESALEIGAIGLVHKPYKVKVLIERIETVRKVYNF
ncbi:MAG: response regulator [Pseudobdellovibrio sp.]